MPTVLIAYDLAPSSTASAALADVVMTLGTQWARPLANLWYVETDRAPIEIEAELSAALEIDDGLLVQQVVGSAVMANTMLRWTPARNSGDHSTSGRVIAWPHPSIRTAEAA